MPTGWLECIEMRAHPGVFLCVWEVVAFFMAFSSSRWMAQRSPHPPMALAVLSDHHTCLANGNKEKALELALGDLCSRAWMYMLCTYQFLGTSVTASVKWGP